MGSHFRQQHLAHLIQTQKVSSLGVSAGMGSHSRIPGLWARMEFFLKKNPQVSGEMVPYFCQENCMDTAMKPSKHELVSEEILHLFRKSIKQLLKQFKTELPIYSTQMLTLRDRAFQENSKHSCWMTCCCRVGNSTLQKQHCKISPP